MASNAPEDRALSQAEDAKEGPEQRRMNAIEEDVPRVQQDEGIEEAEGEPQLVKIAKKGDFQVPAAMDEPLDCMKLAEALKKLPRRTVEKLDAQTRNAISMVKKDAAKMAKQAAAKEGRVEKLTKKQRDMYIPCRVDCAFEVPAPKYLKFIPKYPEYEAGGRYAPGTEYTEVEIDDQFDLCEFVYPKPTAPLLNLEKDRQENIDSLFSHNIEGAEVKIAMYREAIRELAGRLASEQVCPLWIYEVVAIGINRPWNSYMMIMEYELCGAIPYMPMPVEFNALIELFKLEENGPSYERDIELLRFARYPKTAIIPPRVLMMANTIGSFVGIQLVINYLAGRQVITPDTERVVQISDQQDEVGILVSNKYGNILYAMREFELQETRFITPAIFYSNGHVLLKRCSIRNLQDIYTVVDLAIQMDLKGRAEWKSIIPHSKLRDFPDEMDVDQASIVDRVASRLEEFNTKYEPDLRVPLPEYHFIHRWQTHRNCNSLLQKHYDAILSSLHSRSDSPMSSSLFRFVNREEGNHLAVVIPNSEIYNDTLQNICVNLHIVALQQPSELMGTFIYRWESKELPRYNLSSDMTKEALGPQAEREAASDIYLDMYAPTNITVVIWATKKPIKRGRGEEMLMELIRTSFQQRYEIFDALDLNDGGSVMNLFTRANAFHLAKTYKSAYEISPNYSDKFIDFLDKFTQESADPKIVKMIKEGLDQGLVANNLLKFVEKNCRTKNRTLIINCIKSLSAYKRNIVKPKPPFPADILDYPPGGLESYTDNQLRIANFVQSLLPSSNFEKGKDHRNLLICGPTATFKTSFTYFLDKYFNVFWKEDDVTSQHKFWLGVPTNTQIIIVDNWIPKDSDWTWISNVEEGSDNHVNQRYKEDSLIPAETRILLLTLRPLMNIKESCRASDKQSKTSTIDDVWNEFTRRFDIVTLTGKSVTHNSVTRVDVVQRSMTLDPFKRRFRGDGDVRMSNTHAPEIPKSRRLLEISDISDMQQKRDQLYRFLNELVDENVGLASVIRHHTLMQILRREPSENMVRCIIEELSDLIDTGLS